MTQNSAAFSAYEHIFSYSRVASVERTTSIIDLDCVDENPNSYESLKRVFDNILEYLKDSGRKYIVVVVDGSPYSLGIWIIRDNYTCDICNCTLMVEESDSHKEMHNGVSTTYSRKYKKIVLRAGNGHVEMTIVRSILAFFWEPFIKPIAKHMGYSSENALLFAKKGYDHHRSYNLLM